MSKKISELAEATTITGTELVPIVQDGETVQTTISELKPYKVYTALLTQSGSYNEVAISSGELSIGVTYEIYEIGNIAGDWTNVGAPNNEIGTKFVATGGIPTSWGNGNGLRYNTGAPTAIVLENTIGNIWFEWVNNPGNYSINSDGLFATILLFYTAYSGTNDDVSANVLFYKNSRDLISIDVGGGAGFLNQTPIEIRLYN